MTKFQQAVQPKVTVEELKAKFGNLAKYTDEEWQQTADHMNSAEIWMNDLYQVNVTCEGDWVHLSIKRRDKQPIRVWRDLQEIKNEILGPEIEAVELYPAESRLVDSANQYHLWAYRQKDFKWPFGYKERFVMDGDGEITADGARQEPLKKKVPNET